MKRKLKATPRFIMLLTLICLIFAGAVMLSQQAKLNEIAAKQAALDEQYAALQAEEQLDELIIDTPISDGPARLHSLRLLAQAHYGKEVLNVL